MSEQFKVGEVAILQPDPSITISRELIRMSGEEVIVAGPLATWSTDCGPQYTYMVTHPSHAFPFFCAPHELRRKKPPTTGESLIRVMFEAPPQLVKVPA
jgi:hypothetical protein